ncbi:hypothetical protein [Shewanella sp.]|uniref:hypothetical protein n=1 Tax=Shewanella sp. TaxID=50422 RepID=UPI00356A3F1A
MTRIPHRLAMPQMKHAGQSGRRLLAGLLLLFIISPAALAYEPSEGHRPLTQSAFEVLERCNIPLDTELKQQVMAGNLAMDMGAGKLPATLMDSNPAKALYPMKVRIHNWHFYHPDKTSDAQRLSGKTDMSMARLWQAGVTGLTEADSSQQGYYLGALIHLIQDVTVPAHTVPVYHGPKIIAWKREFAPLVSYLGLSFRGLFSISDPIDNWPVSPITGIHCPDPVRLTSDLTLGDSLNQLRDATARQTLAALAVPMAGCNQRWGIFWQQDIGHKYFSGYNQQLKPMDKMGDFSIENQRCTPDYQGFVAGRQKAAVDATVLALGIWLKQSGE